MKSKTDNLRSFGSKTPMCHRDLGDLDREDYRDGWEVGPSGQEEHVTRYADGSSKVHGSGPAGPMFYDKYGNEC